MRWCFCRRKDSVRGLSVPKDIFYGLNPNYLEDPDFLIASVGHLSGPFSATQWISGLVEFSDNRSWCLFIMQDSSMKSATSSSIQNTGSGTPTSVPFTEPKNFWWALVRPVQSYYNYYLFLPPHHADEKIILGTSIGIYFDPTNRVYVSQLGRQYRSTGCRRFDWHCRRTYCVVLVLVYYSWKIAGRR